MTPEDSPCFSENHFVFGSIYGFRRVTRFPGNSFALPENYSWLRIFIFYFCEFISISENSFQFLGHPFFFAESRWFPENSYRASYTLFLLSLSGRPMPYVKFNSISWKLIFRKLISGFSLMNFQDIPIMCHMLVLIESVLFLIEVY